MQPEVIPKVFQSLMQPEVIPKGCSKCGWHYKDDNGVSASILPWCNKCEARVRDICGAVDNRVNIHTCYECGSELLSSSRDGKLYRITEEKEIFIDVGIVNVGISEFVVIDTKKYLKLQRSVKVTELGDMGNLGELIGLFKKSASSGEFIRNARRTFDGLIKTYDEFIISGEFSAAFY